MFFSGGLHGAATGAGDCDCYEVLANSNAGKNLGKREQCSSASAAPS